MNSIKKINLLFCLVFSFVLLFSSVFSVQAAEAIKERQILPPYIGPNVEIVGFMLRQQTLQQCIDPEEYPNEIAECVVDYRVKNYINEGIIWEFGEIEFRMAKKPWYQRQYDYKFGPSNVKLSADKKSAEIFVTLTRDGFGFWNHGEKINLTFELKIN